MARRRRVVITGLGVVAPNGIGKDAFWKNLIAGKSAVDYIHAFDPSPYPCKVAAEVRDFDATDFISPKNARNMWRFSQFGVAAALLAVEDARLSHLPENAAVSFGTSVNGLGGAEALHAQFLDKGLRRVPPSVVLEATPHTPGSYIAIELGIRTPVKTISSNCCTGLDVVRDAFLSISHGMTDLVIAGASEAPIFPFTFAAFSALGLLSTRNDPPQAASRPYDLLRDGLVLGEGGGAVVLEELESALSRNAHIYAEVAGQGACNEALDMRGVDTSGAPLASAIQLALADARLGPNDIDYINSHGSSLPDYDICDVNAFKAAFGDRIYNIPVSSIKSMLGQAVSVSGIFQVVASALAIAESVIPPTINQELPDPRCDLDFVPNDARHCRVNSVLMNAHAIGGSLSVLILKRLHLS